MSTQISPVDESATKPSPNHSLGWIERLLCRLFDYKVIVNCDRDPYLHRWYLIRRKNFAIFLHKFIRSDEDRALHDHPWNFFVLPIWRGYIEHSERDMTTAELWDHFEHPFGGITTVPVRRRVWPIISARFRRGTYKHRVELLKRWPPHESDIVFNERTHCYDHMELPSWSLFVRFREWREWGFHLPEGWKKWNEFWKEKCE